MVTFIVFFKTKENVCIVMRLIHKGFFILLELKVKNFLTLSVTGLLKLACPKSQEYLNTLAIT